MPEKQPQYINSIIRAMNILELYAKLNVQSLGIADISKELNLQKTTVFNIVKTLLHQGWLIQDSPNGKYKLGTRVLRVATMVTQHISTEDLFLQEMHRLRDMFNEDVVLTAMIDGVPVCIDKVQSANMLRMTSQVGRVSSLVRGSTGKALFALQSEEFIASTLDSTYPDTEAGAREKERIRAQLQTIRHQGYCVSTSEQDEGVTSVSVPIRGENGIAEYSLAVVGAEPRMVEKGIDTIRKELVSTAHRLEQDGKLLPY